MHHKPKTEIRRHRVYKSEVFSLVIIKWSYWLERAENEKHVTKELKTQQSTLPPSYSPPKQWRYQHTLQMLQPLNTHATHFDTIVSKIIISAAFSFLFMDIITPEEEKGRQIFHRRKNDGMKQGTYWEPTWIRRHGPEIRSLAVYEVSMIDCYLLLR